MKSSKLNPYICFYSCLIIFIAACSPPAETSDNYIVNGDEGRRIDGVLTPHLQEIVSTHDLPGMSVALVKENEILYARAFGYENIKDSIPVSIHSIFHMASISKPFVATAIMQLVEDGKINLDSSIVYYLPYFKVDGEKYLKITIQQMLSHISGMPDVTDYEWYNPQYDKEAIERYVRSISDEKMISSPGLKFAYSNMAFECLGDVISKVTGMSFADYVKKEILDPIGMKESTFLMGESLPENWASPYIRLTHLEQAEDYPYNRRHGPSSTLHSNAVEMCYWAMANMNMGEYGNTRILEASSYDELWKPWFKIEGDLHIGLSWFLDTYKEFKTIGHGGGDIGFSTNLLMLPEKKLALIILCNLNSAPLQEISDLILDVALAYEPYKINAPVVIKEIEQEYVETSH